MEDPMKTCPKCFYSNLDTNEFCDECGSPLPSIEEKHQVNERSYPLKNTSDFKETNTSIVNDDLLIQIRKLNDTVANIETNTRNKEIVIQNIDMPFWSIVRFMVKWSIASIPAAIILIIIGAILTAIFSGLFTALFH
jgi:hypothetical protein